ncbi:MAG TPA: hypothetical protein VIM40_04455 [Arthrobacter sp.]|jgi:ATP-dependent Clp protease ATP-binding subunit ClpC
MTPGPPRPTKDSPASEIHPGDIVMVDVDGEGDDAKFTFAGNAKTRIPDALPAAG